MQQGNENMFSGQNIKILSSMQQGTNNLFSGEKIKILEPKLSAPVVSTAKPGKDSDFDAGEFSGYIPFVPVLCKLSCKVHEHFILISSIRFLLGNLSARRNLIPTFIFLLFRNAHFVIRLEKQLITCWSLAFSPDSFGSVSCSILVYKLSRHS